MLTILREQLLNHLIQLSEVINSYQNYDTNYADRALKWLLDTEKTLQKNRNPASSCLAVSRAKILAANDGLRDKNISSNGFTKRQIMRATVSLALDESEQKLSIIINDIDMKIDIWTDKMSQFLAVATTNTPIPLPPTEPRSNWLNKVWEGFNISAELHGMYAYLNSAMSKTDRQYVLGNVIDNLLSNSKKHQSQKKYHKLKE